MKNASQNSSSNRLITLRLGLIARCSKVLLLVCTLFLVSISSKASHVSGVDIEYSCVGANQYLIKVNIYRDCAGITMPNTIDLELASTCGQAFTTTINMGIPPGGTVVGGIEISQLCPQYLPQSTCNGGSLPGMEHYQYSDTITLNPACDNWTASWDVCCRNASIVNLQNPNGAAIYGETELYTVTDSCNNSPVFSAPPIPYVCLGQPVFFNFGAVDPDGDSLVYGLIPPRQSATGFLPFNPTYSVAQPIPGITLDPQTGAITFTPTIQGEFVVAVRVLEYDSNGNIVGMTMRDIQFSVINCPTNTVPAPEPQVTNQSGDFTITGLNSILICPGDSMRFDVTFNDANALDTITLTSNVQSVLPGATFSVAGVNPAIATISWTAMPIGSSSSASFVITAFDNGCTVPGLNQQTIFVQLADTVKTVPDVLICNSGSAQLSATGGTSYQWSVLSGPPIVVGTNFSCNPCANPIATPTATTVYMVESNVTGQCINTDTVEIAVVPPFSFSAVTTTDVTCNGAGDGEVFVSAQGGSGNGWLWYLIDGSGTIIDSAATATNHTFTGLDVDTFTIVLEAVEGCPIDTSFSIAEPAPLLITVSDTTICVGSSAVLTTSATGGNGTYTYNWGNGLAGNGPHNVTPSQTTSYSIFGVDQLGCMSPTDSVTVFVNPPLSVVVSAPDSICAATTATLTAAASGGDGGPYTYSWTALGMGVIDSASTTSVVPSTPASTYIVQISDGCNTPSVMDTVTVVLHETPEPLVSSNILEACVGDVFTFFNDTDSSLVGANCQWDLGDGTIINGGCNSVNHAYQNAGCYDISLTVLSPAGCPGDSTFSQLVCARPLPLADFNFEPEPANVDDPLVFFENLSVNGVSHTWQFGFNGIFGASNLVDPIWLFPDDNAGLYPVQLLTTNIYGCQDSVTKIVQVDADFFLWMPNAFTPDGDGKNDIIGVAGVGISSENFSLQIFNRWGELVFESNDPAIGWDGSGAIDGVYAYRIQAQNFYSKIKKEVMGHVTLLR